MLKVLIVTKAKTSWLIWLIIIPSNSLNIYIDLIVANSYKHYSIIKILSLYNSQYYL